MSSQTKSESLTSEPRGSLEVKPTREIGVLPEPAFVGLYEGFEKDTEVFVLLGSPYSVSLLSATVES